MTAQQLVSRLRKWQGRLGLAPWSITVEHWDEPNDAWAAAEVSPQYRRATISLDPGLRLAAEGLIEGVLVHELLHVLMRDVDEAVEAAASQLHPHAKELAAKRYTHAVEGFVEALSQAIIALPAPLPPARPGRRAGASPRARDRSRRA